MKAGYLLSITSWANDGDNYKTITIDGLMEQDVVKVLEVCSLFTSYAFGNIYEGTEAEVSLASAAVLNVLTLNGVVSGEEYNYAKEDCCDYIAQYLGREEGYSFRVFDTYKVYYLPEAAADVTLQFRSV